VELLAEAGEPVTSKEVEEQHRAQSQAQTAEEKSPAALLLEKFRARPKTVGARSTFGTEEFNVNTG